jgi:hypothetical protein
MVNSLVVFLCSHQMQRFFFISHVMGILFCGALILSILWLYRVSIPRQVVKGYPWSVRLHMSLPFNRHWIDEVAPEHVARIRKFRRAQFSLALVLLAFGLWIVAYDDLLGTRLIFMLAAGRCGQ